MQTIILLTHHVLQKRVTTYQKILLIRRCALLLTSKVYDQIAHSLVMWLLVQPMRLTKHLLKKRHGQVVREAIAEEIKPADCTKIERGLELISPLPRENVGGLIAFVVDIAERQALPTCTASQTLAKR